LFDSTAEASLAILSAYFGRRHRANTAKNRLRD
jgi:hypothetical protein